MQVDRARLLCSRPLVVLIRLVELGPAAHAFVRPDPSCVSQSLHAESPIQ